jgi:hypothetical protein
MPDLLGLHTLLSPETLLALCDDDNDGTPDSGVLEEAIASATREVRRAVAGVVQVPQDAPLPPMLTDIVRTLSIERLYERRRETLPGPWRDRSHRARLLLAEVARGERPVEGAPTPARRIASTVQPDQRVHTAGKITL